MLFQDACYIFSTSYHNSHTGIQCISYLWTNTPHEEEDRPLAPSYESTRSGLRPVQRRTRARPEPGSEADFGPALSTVQTQPRGPRPGQLPLMNPPVSDACYPVPCWWWSYVELPECTELLYSTAHVLPGCRTTHSRGRESHEPNMSPVGHDVR